MSLGADRPPRRGDILADRYDVRELLASDSLTCTVRALDQEKDRPVLLRCTAPRLLSDREARAMHDRLRPIVGAGGKALSPLLDVVRDGSVVATIEPWPNGNLLADRVRQKGLLAPREVHAIATKLFAALASIPSPFWHGDLRLERVFVGADGAVLTGGFLVSLLPGDAVAPALKLDVGLRRMFAPEVGEGLGGPPADRWGAAALLWELLSGRPPEPGLRAAPPVWGGLGTSLLACLHPDPAARPASLEPLRAALAGFAGQPVAPLALDAFPGSGPQHSSFASGSIEVPTQVMANPPGEDPSDPGPADPTEVSPPAARRSGKGRRRSDTVETPFSEIAAAHEAAAPPAAIAARAAVASSATERGGYDIAAPTAKYSPRDIAAAERLAQTTTSGSDVLRSEELEELGAERSGAKKSESAREREGKRPSHTEEYGAERSGAKKSESAGERAEASRGSRRERRDTDRDVEPIKVPRAPVPQKAGAGEPARVKAQPAVAHPEPVQPKNAAPTEATPAGAGAATAPAKDGRSTRRSRKAQPAEPIPVPEDIKPIPRPRRPSIDPPDMGGEVLFDTSRPVAAAAPAAASASPPSRRAAPAPAPAVSAGPAGQPNKTPAPRRAPPRAGSWRIVLIAVLIGIAIVGAAALYRYRQSLTAAEAGVSSR